MVERKQVESVIDNYLAGRFNIDKAKITDDLNLQNDLDADSIDRIELVLEAEDYLDLSILDDQAENLQTIGKLVDYIVEHSNK